MIFDLSFNIFSAYFLGYYILWNARIKFLFNLKKLRNKNLLLSERAKAVCFVCSYIIVWPFLLRSIIRVLFSLQALLK